MTDPIELAYRGKHTAPGDTVLPDPPADDVAEGPLTAEQLDAHFGKNLQDFYAGATRPPLVHPGGLQVGPGRLTVVDLTEVERLRAQLARAHDTIAKLVDALTRRL